MTTCIRRHDPGSAADVAGGWAFLLIHGAQMDGAGWAAVQPLLAAPSFAVDLPGRPASRLPELVPSESQKLAYALEDLSSLDAERVVVVGHSAAGGILPGLFAAGTKVRHSVYVTCLVAPPGRTTHHAVPPLLRIGLSVYRRWCMARGRTHTAVIGSGPVRRRIALLLLNAVPRSERADLLGHFWPEPNSELDLVAPASLSPGPCTVVLCLRDRVIGLRSQIAALRHLGPGVRAVAIDADHFPAMSRPTELAAVLNDVLAMARSQEAASDLRRR